MIPFTHFSLLTLQTCTLKINEDGYQFFENAIFIG